MMGNSSGVAGTRLKRLRGGDSTHLVGPEPTEHPAPPASSPRRPARYLHGTARGQVAHVIQGPHLRLGLLLEVQLLTFNLDVSST